MATSPYDNTAPNLAERYEAASQTSDLTVAGGMAPPQSGTTQGDIVLAAGMSESRLGMALLRLHSEWSCAAKPRRVPIDGIARMTEAIRQDDEKARASAKTRGVKYQSPNGSPWQRANEEAAKWYVNELLLLAQHLKGRALVLEQLNLWAEGKGIGPGLVSETLHWWLDHTCRTCEGHGIRHLENQAARQCGACYGTGETRRPEGSGVLLNHMEYVLGVARGSLKKRLRG